jgi:hypothetical protein
MNRFPLMFLLCAVIFYLTSCKTYYIPVDSFREQFVGLEPSKEVTTRGPGGDKVKYMTYPITSIKCVDKKGSAYNLTASPSLEIRFTYGNNQRTIFYFDLIRINDTLLTGGQSRFMPSIKKTISLNSIKKIEIQDGHKKFVYVN